MDRKWLLEKFPRSTSQPQKATTFALRGGVPYPNTLLHLNSSQSLQQLQPGAQGATLAPRCGGGSSMNPRCWKKWREIKPRCLAPWHPWTTLCQCFINSNADSTIKANCRAGKASPSLANFGRSQAGLAGRILFFIEFQVSVLHILLIFLYVVLYRLVDKLLVVNYQFTGNNFFNFVSKVYMSPKL